MSIRGRYLSLFIMTLLSLEGCAPEVVDEISGDFPVTVMRLDRVSPQAALSYTGSVLAWNQEELSFEVSGRVVHTVDAGSEVLGPLKRFDAEGKSTLVPGMLLASLDEEEYINNRDIAESRVMQMENNVTSVELSIQAISQRILAADAELSRAVAERSRVEDLFAKKVATRAELDQVVATQITAEAGVEELKSTKLSRDADLLVARSHLSEAKISLGDAERDLRNCHLYAPFPGQVSQLKVTNGGNVAASQSVLTLVMMNPIKVEFQVSAETDRSIYIGGEVQIASFDVGSNGRPFLARGKVYQKATIADPNTRTFTVSILLSNMQTESAKIPKEFENLPRIRDTRSVVTMPFAGKIRKFVEARAIQGGDEPFVWVAEGTTRAEFLASQGATFRLKKVPVRRGELEIELPLQTIGVELADSNGLGLDDVLATDVPADYEEGSEVIFSRVRWVFRPGDTVRVHLRNPKDQSGLYVPVMAINTDPASGEEQVFVVNESHSAKPVAIKRVSTWGDYVNIAENDSLKPGTSIVVKGAHLMRPEGQTVTVVGEESPPSGTEKSEEYETPAETAEEKKEEQATP